MVPGWKTAGVIHTVTALLADATRRLTESGSANAAGESRLLLAHVLSRRPSELILLDRIDPLDADRFAALVARRTTGIPLQHLTGRAYFRHVELEVGPGVFVPRPETEVMTGWALDRLVEMAGSPVVVELGTGSGAIAKALVTEHPAARVHAVELSDPAYAYAERNLAGTGVDLRLGDMADAFGDLDGDVDLVIVNPPYIPLEAWESVPAEVRDHDPQLALFSGDDGLDALRVVAVVSARLLRPGGWLCAEHAEVQHDSAQQVLLDHQGFGGVRDHLDLTDRYRFVTGQRVTS